jgi:crossover junction endodeoxyribonuclease RuvC
MAGKQRKFSALSIFSTARWSATVSVIGIDPGAHGAVAVLDEGGDLVEIHDMPSLEETLGRPTTNAPLLAAILAKVGARIAFCEFVSARPADSRTGAFSFGRARGVMEGVCGALGIPVVFLTPPTWKRLANIAPGAENKDQARARAIAKWPAKAELFAP